MGSLIDNYKNNITVLHDTVKNTTELLNANIAKWFNSSELDNYLLETIAENFLSFTVYLCHNDNMIIARDGYEQEVTWEDKKVETLFGHYSPAVFYLLNNFENYLQEVCLSFYDILEIELKVTRKYSVFLTKSVLEYLDNFQYEDHYIVSDLGYEFYRRLYDLVKNNIDLLMSMVLKFDDSIIDMMLMDSFGSSMKEKYNLEQEPNRNSDFKKLKPEFFTGKDLTLWNDFNEFIKLL